MDYITHYYRNEDGPFRSLSKLPYDKALEIIKQFNIDEALVYRRFKNPEKYLKERQVTEQWLRSEFIKKGGTPLIENPHYLVLGSSDYIYDGYNQNCKQIKVPICSINKKELSFTYPDSMVSYWLAKTKQKESFFQSKYHGKVFSYDEIIELLKEVQYTNKIWESDESRAFDFFIEAQLWTDTPILDYFNY